MRWMQGRRSENVEDRRGMSVPTGIAGGGIGAVILVLIALFLGVDPSILLEGDSGDVAPSSQQQSAGDDQQRDFVSVVLADTEDTWSDLFQQTNRHYEDPKLVLFSGAIQSACGFAQAAVGPFYCPSDRKVYLDLSFFRALQDRFHAPGDFAEAYVIAHEVGHHVQNLLGIAGRVAGARSRMDEADANALSVRTELQADCFAGVWAHHADRVRHILEAGDIEEALNAASAIGDDRLQRQAQGYVVPESFTHGSSAQRVHWFKRGFETGAVRDCDTFSANSLR